MKKILIKIRIYFFFDAYRFLKTVMLNPLLLVILFVWELPQNVLGIIYLLRKTMSGSVISRSFERGRLFVHVTRGAVSLGFFIFWCDRGDRYFHLDERNKEHEYGHSIQSRLLGPLYLPMVGVPSVGRVVYARRFYRRHGAAWSGYYNGFPEKWADKLGGVNSGAL